MRWRTTLRASFDLEWRALVRGKALWASLAAVAFVHWLAPGLVRGDGTDAGVREMGIRLAAGGSFAVALLVTLAAGCGLFAREREMNRLGLTLVRPAHAFGVVTGRWLALSLFAGILLAFSGGLLLCRDAWSSTPCRHHFAPRLPSPMSVAMLQYDRYVADPNTLDVIRKAPKSAVLQHLAMKENERYEVARPGETLMWDFGTFPKNAVGVPVVAIRFAASYDMRLDVRGTFNFRTFGGDVSNKTQSVLEFPLASVATNAGERLSFVNRSPQNVMVRPRRDVELLLPADSFALNDLRAGVEMLSIAMFLAAFGMFLSSCLSKPVSLFTSLSLVAVALMAPGVVEQYPDTFDANFIDKTGLVMSRFVASLTDGLSNASPVANLSQDRCVEWSVALRALATNGLLLSAFLLAAAAALIRRKPR